MSTQQVTTTPTWVLSSGVDGEVWTRAPRKVPGQATPPAQLAVQPAGKPLHWHLISARPRAGAVAGVGVETDVHGGQQWVAHVVTGWLNWEGCDMTWEALPCSSGQSEHIGTGARLTPSFEALRVQGCCRDAVVSRLMRLLSPRAGRLRILACRTSEVASECCQPMDPAQAHQLEIARTVRWTSASGTRSYTSSPTRNRATGPVSCSFRSYGGRCWMCKRRLKDPVSVELGIGPVCRGRYERRRAQAPTAGPR